MICDIGPDLILENAMPTASRIERSKQVGSILFHPSNYLEMHPNMTLESE